MSRTNINPAQIVLSQSESRLLRKAARRNLPAAKCKSLISKGLVDEEKKHNPGYMPTPTGYIVINRIRLLGICETAEKTQAKRPFT